MATPSPGSGPLHVLCAGAAQGLVSALQERFLADTGATVQARFGAVGALRQALDAGEPCDVMVVTEAMVADLVAEGRLRRSGGAALGRVRTGIAVPIGQPRPDVATPEALRVALLAADAICFPDPVRATAGIHFARVLRELGIHDTLQQRLRTFANGATTMRELAASKAQRAIGCTQISEILYSTGVALVAALPSPFELATVYAAAVAATARQPGLATRFIDLLGGAGARDLRAAGGFES